MNHTDLVFVKVENLMLLPDKLWNSATTHTHKNEQGYCLKICKELIQNMVEFLITTSSEEKKSSYVHRGSKMLFHLLLLLTEI